MAPHDVVVFLGPSLPVAEARRHLDAIYLPPAENGSVFRAVTDHRPSAIAIVDGVLAQQPAVRHKEILWALAVGVEVWGSSSMGALRAAELASQGMQGSGFIYRWYRVTRLADDDEVAVSMAPPELGSAILSDALIDVRLTLKRAERQGIMGSTMRRKLEAIARALHFHDRRYAAIMEIARKAGVEAAAELDRLEAWIPLHAVQQKREDAIELLGKLAGRQPDPAARCAPGSFELTEAWAADLDAASLWDVYRKQAPLTGT